MSSRLSSGNADFYYVPEDDYYRQRNIQGRSKHDRDKRDDEGKKPSQSGKLYKVYSRWVEKASMQGLPFMHYSKLWFATAFWALATVVAIGACIAHLYYLITLYYERGTSSSITLGFANLDLPAITVCNVNPVRFSKLNATTTAFQDFIASINPEALINSNSNNTGRRKRAVSSVNTTSYFNTDDYRDTTNSNSKKKKLGDKSRTTTIEEQFFHLYSKMSRNKRFKIGHHLADMLIDCSFNGRECSASQWTQSLSNVYGNCFTLSNDNYVVDTSGPEGGLSLVFLTENHEVLPGISNGYGLRVVIHDKNTTDFPRDEGIDIPTYAETSVGIRKLNITRLGTPYNECVDQDSYISRYGVSYTRTTCQQFCQHRLAIKRCDCFNAFRDDLYFKMESKSGTIVKPCKTKAELTCLYGLLDELETNTSVCGCLSPCSETKYVKTTSLKVWPTSIYAQYLLNTVCDSKGRTSTVCQRLVNLENSTQDLAQYFLKLNIYFEDLNFESLDEQPNYEGVQFYSDVGGALGLWLGLSVLSMAEVLHLIVELMHSSCGSCCSSEEQKRKHAGDKDTSHASRDSKPVQTFVLEESSPYAPNTRNVATRHMLDVNGYYQR